MGSSSNAFASTPTFELFRRGLEPRTVKRFHGINAYAPLSQLGPDWAQDILNVIVNSNGELSKFRLPQLLTTQTPSVAWGVVQVVDFFGAAGNLTTSTTISNTAGNTMVLTVQFDDTAHPNLFTVSDTQGNTWTKITQIGDNGNIFSQVWYAFNIRGGINTITCTESASIVIGSFVNPTVTEYQGMPTIDPLVASNAFTSQTGKTITSTANNQFVLSSLRWWNSTCNLTAGAGWNQRSVEFAVNVPQGMNNSTGLYQDQFVPVSGTVVTETHNGNPPAIGPAYILVLFNTGGPPQTFPTGPQTIFDFQQANGTRQIFANLGTDLGYYKNDGQFGPVIVSGPLVINTGPWSLVEVSNILIGGNGQRIVKWTGTDLLNVGIASPLTPPAVISTSPGNLSPIFGYEWAFSWKSSGIAPGLAGPSPIEVGTASPNNAQSGAGNVNVRYNVTTNQVVPSDPQIDTVVWFRTLDGGGDLFRLAEINIFTGAVTFNAGSVAPFGAAPFVAISDNTPDLPLVLGGPALDQTIRAPLLNNPPIVGKYLAVGQGRVVIANLAGAPQDAIYSGAERILIGNPPECYPPNNRLRLSIGAESIAGVGVLTAGVVAFSNTDKMFMLRGQLEDITDTAPVQFTQYLQELPWKIGCLSHATVQATPYGLVWLAGDKTVQLFDGQSTIQDISGPVYPILRGITAGAEGACSSAYFNWLERDWFALLVPFNGSITPNRMIFWALEKDNNAIDIFISTIQADGIGTVTTSTLQRRLIIGLGGKLYRLPIESDTIGGISDLTLIPATAGQLQAYWRGGYFGNDTPQRSEMFRWGRLITDQNAAAFAVTLRLVDDDTNTLDNPRIVPRMQLAASKFTINQRAKRCSVEINFPVQDVSANVMELQLHSIPSSDR
jgi:hypothetical protein